MQPAVTKHQFAEAVCAITGRRSLANFCIRNATQKELYAIGRYLRSRAAFIHTDDEEATTKVQQVNEQAVDDFYEELIEAAERNAKLGTMMDPIYVFFAFHGDGQCGAAQWPCTVRARHLPCVNSAWY
jgi:tellurite resistance protein